MKYKEDRDELRIEITMRRDGGSDIIFCADSNEATAEWLQYCVVLLTLPNYTIAEPPKQNFISEEIISQHSNPHRFGAGVYIDV